MDPSDRRRRGIPQTGDAAGIKAADESFGVRLRQLRGDVELSGTIAVLIDA
jgi:hypothetical protein